MVQHINSSSPIIAGHMWFFNHNLNTSWLMISRDAAAKFYPSRDPTHNTIASSPYLFRCPNWNPAPAADRSRTQNTIASSPYLFRCSNWNLAPAADRSRAQNTIASSPHLFYCSNRNPVTQHQQPAHLQLQTTVDGEALSHQSLLVLWKCIQTVGFSYNKRIDDVSRGQLVNGYVHIRIRRVSGRKLQK